MVSRLSAHVIEREARNDRAPMCATKRQCVQQPAIALYVRATKCGVRATTPGMAATVPGMLTTSDGVRATEHTVHTIDPATVHCVVHCLGSLFGTLCMDTGHWLLFKKKKMTPENLRRHTFTSLSTIFLSQ